MSDIVHNRFNDMLTNQTRLKPILQLNKTYLNELDINLIYEQGQALINPSV
jgi:hypothetical protein